MTHARGNDFVWRRDRIVIPRLPDDVRAWLANVLGQCNIAVSERFTRIPTLHEPSLDMALVEHLSDYGAGYAFASGWVVTLMAFYEGGRRHYAQWEIADLGLIVIVRRGNSIVARKVALLQSKRLYPHEVPLLRAEETVARLGFFDLVEGRSRGGTDPTEPRLFTTTETSKYEALKIGDRQFVAIESFQKEVGVPVHYLLYNPWDLPVMVELPVRGAPVLPEECRVGCRVIPARVLHDSLQTLGQNSSPNYSEICDRLPDPFRTAATIGGWSLDHFVVDHVLTCDEGYLAEGLDDPRFFRVTFQRSAPISAAIAIVFDIP